MNDVQKFRHILIIEDRKGRRIIPLEEDLYTIGRDSENPIVLYDYQVSRTHATIIRTIDDEDLDNFSYRILDGNLEGKKSTNGIYVNGRLTVSHQLKHSDNISFGSEAKARYYIVSTESGIDLFNPEGLEQIAASRTTLESQSDDTLASEKDKTNSQEQQELIHLASFPELSPNPIIELDWDGNLTYVNPAGALKFPTLYEEQLAHPILSNLLCEDSNRQGNLFLREVKIGVEVFEQYVHYLSEQKLIRSYIFDFTKRKVAEAQLRENQARYQTIIGQISQGILLAYVHNRRIIEANSALLKLLGYSPSEISSLNLYNIIANDLTNINKDLTSVAETKENLVGKYLFRRPDGSLLNLEASIGLTSYQSKDIFCFVIQNVYSAPEKEFTDYLTYHDQETHLPNQKLFTEQFNILLARAANDHYLMGLIAIKIDNWQSFISTQAPEQSQELLKNLVQIVSTYLQGGDLFARWEQDIFMILLPRIKGPKNPSKISKKISTTLNQYLEQQSEQSEIKLQAQTSLLIYPIDGEDSSLLLKNSLLSLEKETTANNPNYSATGFYLTPKSSSLLKLENLIDNAIQEKQFFLCYQPQIETSNQTLIGLEALLRWNHPELGTVSPLDFLRLTEETDFMLPLGIWILQTATLQLKKWLEEGINPVPIGVNISSRQFIQSNFVNTIAKVLEQTGLPPHLLELELTENCFLHNSELAYQTVAELSALQVRLCLDGFGTGYSALTHLQQVSFHTVKISPQIISKIAQEPKTQTLVQSVKVLCEGYGSRLIAVGVECSEQLEILKEIGCREVQGNLFSLPLPSKEISHFIHQSDIN